MLQKSPKNRVYEMPLYKSGVNVRHAYPLTYDDAVLIYLAETISWLSSEPQYRVLPASETAKLEMMATGNELVLQNMTQANMNRL